MAIESVNDFVVRFANVNGSGSASANALFARAVMRMGVPVATRNIFPSNIQGLPTWFEVRVCEQGWLGAAIPEEHGGLGLGHIELCAIAEELATRHPGAGIWPAAAPARAVARVLAAEMHAGFAALRSHFAFNVEANLPQVGQRTLAGQPALRADVARITQMWNECLAASGGPFLFGGFGIADAFYAPVVLRFRTYGVPLDATCVGYARRIMECAAVREWIDAALAEKDFVASEEPYRSPPEDTRG